MAKNNHDEDEDVYRRTIHAMDDDLRNLKEGLDATKAWSEQVCRIADALEHMSMGQTMMALTAMGLKTEFQPSAKHREECPSCQCIKYAHPVKVISS